MPLKEHFNVGQALHTLKFLSVLSRSISFDVIYPLPFPSHLKFEEPTSKILEIVSQVALSPTLVKLPDCPYVRQEPYQGSIVFLGMPDGTLSFGRGFCLLDDIMDGYFYRHPQMVTKDPFVTLWYEDYAFPTTGEILHDFQRQLEAIKIEKVQHRDPHAYHAQVQQQYHGEKKGEIPTLASQFMNAKDSSERDCFPEIMNPIQDWSFPLPFLEIFFYLMFLILKPSHSNRVDQQFGVRASLTSNKRRLCNLTLYRRPLLQIQCKMSHLKIPPP